jgi:hypothetical protein
MLLRISYWTGALIDGLAAVQVLLPASVTVLAFQGLSPGGAAARPALMAAVLMLGFAGLLLWADRRPFERRGVLGITLLVVMGLAAANAYLGLSGARPWADLLPSLAIQAALAVLFSVALTTARPPGRGDRAS